MVLTAFIRFSIGLFLNTTNSNYSSKIIIYFSKKFCYNMDVNERKERYHDYSSYPKDAQFGMGL